MTAAAGTEIAGAVNGHGIIVPPGNAKAFAGAIRELAADKALREKYGAAARKYAEENLERDVILGRFAEEISGRQD